MQVLPRRRARPPAPKLLLALSVLAASWVAPTRRAAAAASVLSQNAVQSLQRTLAHPGLSGAKVGVAVARADSGEPLFDRGGTEQLIPASNVKIVTTAAALTALSADYQFKTELYGAMDQTGHMAGDLTVVGYGDPYLVPERLHYLASRLYYAGLRAVDGDLVVDDHYFAHDARMAFGAEEDRTSHAYMAPAGALSAGFNALMVHVLPGATLGAPAQILLDPEQGYARVQGRINTVARVTQPLTVDVMPQGAQSVVRVAGQIAHTDPGRAYWRRIDQPALFTGALLRAALIKQGIEVRGRVRRGTLVAQEPLLYTARSPRLAELLGPLNKYSNNFMAMQVALTLGAQTYGAPATWDKAHRALAQFMADHVGIAPGSYTLKNASGLHSVNRMSAAQLVQVLGHMHKDPTVNYEFIASLAVAAGSGTLQDRMLGTPAAHRLRAKTGTLMQASALSGYVTSRDGTPLCFSMLVNNYRHIALVWAAQDAFADALAQLNLQEAAPFTLPVAEDGT